jgi:regulator of protease activity HflC (stomatin/prohibitin superfamily)
MTRHLVAFIAIIVLALAATACGPYRVEPIEEIGPNETAFVVPLEGDNKDTQGQFVSVEYLNQAKVAAKRIVIPVRKRAIGYGPGMYEWIPTMRVIKVDRSPVTREWTATSATGTDRSNQAVSVESKESINFSVGINITASVTEEDAATFLYWYAGAPLKVIVDSNVRGYIQTYLAQAFGKMTIDEVREKKTDVFAAMAAAVTEEFKKKGITVINCGSADGIAYADQKIQDAINENYVASRAEQTATMNARAAVERARGDAQARVIRAEGEAEANDLVARSLTPLLVQNRFAEKWNGEAPKVLGSGTSTLIQLPQ